MNFVKRFFLQVFGDSDRAEPPPPSRGREAPGTLNISVPPGAPGGRIATVEALVWTNGSSGTLVSSPTPPFPLPALRTQVERSSGILPPEALVFNAVSAGAPLVMPIAGPAPMGQVIFPAFNCALSSPLTAGIATWSAAVSFTDPGGVVRTNTYVARPAQTNSTFLLVPTASTGANSQPTSIQLESNTTVASITWTGLPVGVSVTVMPCAAGSGGSSDLYNFLAA